MLAEDYSSYSTPFANACFYRISLLSLPLITNEAQADSLELRP